MHRTFISTVLAAALAMTGISATAARADVYNRYPQQNAQGGNEAVAAALAGIAALFIIGKTIDRHSDRRETVIIQQPPAPRHVHKPRQKVTHMHKKKPRQHAHAPLRKHVNGGKADHWHRHGNGLRHRHAHGPRHHR